MTLVINKTNQVDQHVVLVVDTSGSMASIRKEAEALLRDQLGTSKSLGQNISLISFNTVVETHLENVEDPSGYTVSVIPNGNTALIDAMLEGIALGERVGAKATTLLTITDGEENASRATWSQLKDKVGSKTATGTWTFAVAGASGLTLEAMINQVNIPRGNTIAWQNDAHGTQVLNRQTYAARSLSSANYAAGATATADYFGGKGGNV